MSDITILERIAGSMLGFACGDSLGAPAEYRSRKFIQQKWGRLTDMTGGGIWNPGEWTDDTAMVLATAEGIVDLPEDPIETVGARLLSWREKAKDITDAVASILISYSGDWMKASRSSSAARSGRAYGSGSLARALPVSLAYPQAWRMLEISARLSAMTNWDPQAEVACAVYCLWVDGVLRGRTLDDSWHDAITAAIKVAAHGQMATDTPGPAPLPENFWNRLDTVQDLAVSDLQPTGYASHVIDCLEAVAWCCLKSISAEDAIETAVNLGGDTDTIGALTGGIVGAYWGPAALPTRWTHAVWARDRIVDAARSLAELRRHHEVYATPGVPPFQSYRVAENLHAGRSPLTVRDLKYLARLGVTHFLDLREDVEWAEQDHVGAEAVEAIADAGLRRGTVPIVDGSAPSDDSLDSAAMFLTKAMENPESHVYVHCSDGCRRTAAVLAAYVGAVSRMEYDDVMANLQEMVMRATGTPIGPTDEQAAAVRHWLADPERVRRTLPRNA